MANGRIACIGTLDVGCLRVDAGLDQRVVENGIVVGPEHSGKAYRDDLRQFSSSPLCAFGGVCAQQE